jgi:hypothetical protein
MNGESAFKNAELFGFAKITSSARETMQLQGLDFV